jgi:small subunit ribosomal protein S6
MSLYETVFIARHDLSPSQVDGLIKNYIQVFEENDGKVIKQEYWGLKSLAYRIKKNRKGHYVLFQIDAPSAALQEVERQMRLNEDILRYLSISVEEHDEAPSIMMKHSQRDDLSYSIDMSKKSPDSKEQPKAVNAGETA